MTTALTTSRRDWLLGAVLMLAVIFAYQPAWNAGFIWDDDDYVTNNPLLTAPDGLQRIWFSTDSPSQYFPLVYTSFRAEHALWGFNAAGYHWVNILLHAVNALLVWRLLRRLVLPGAWLAAGIFALHPVQVESVAWITELKNVQSLFFSLLALHAWVRFIDDERRFAWRPYALALLACALALFSKTTACTLPAALLLVLWLKRKLLDLRRLAQIAPFVALGLAMGLLTLWWERVHQGTRAADFGLSVLDRALLASRAVWFYLGKLAWPANLTFSYPRWTIAATDPRAYAGLAALVMATVAIWRWGRVAESSAVLRPAKRLPQVLETRAKAPRYLAAAGFFFIATLSPVLGFIMLYTFRYSFVADHYQYVALLGPVALVAAALAAKLPRPWLASALGGVLLLALGLATWRQARIYTNVETLWRATLARNPASFLAHNNLAAALVAAHRPAEAVAHARQALTLGPVGHDLALAHLNLGNARLQQGDRADALACFQRAVDIEPNFADAHNNLASALVQLGRGAAAIPHFEKVLALYAHHGDAHYNLGNALADLGRLDDAIAHFRAALAIRPGDADVHHDLGVALLRQNRIDDAEANLRAAAKLRPSLAAAHGNLAFLFQQTGRSREAEESYTAALRLQPDNARTRAGFARLLATATDPAVRNELRARHEARRALLQAETQGDKALVAALTELLNSGIAADPAVAQTP